MTAATASEVIVLGAMTGMRSMSGAATLGLRYGGVPASVTTVMALGEMIADKSPFIPNRTEPLPLSGRAFMGALVGGAIARERRSNLLLGGLIGATAAVIGAHLAFRIRTRLPVSTAVGGLLEDAVMLGMATVYAAHAKR